MPIYEYRCENGHTFEVMQRMTDEPLTQCETCSATVQRVFHPVAVHFKGSGFYNTDYGKRKRGAEGGGESSDGKKPDAAKKADGDAKPAASKADSGTSSSSKSSTE